MSLPSHGTLELRNFTAGLIQAQTSILLPTLISHTLPPF